MKQAQNRNWHGETALALTSEPTPVARVSLLVAADAIVEAVAWSPYAQPALMFCGDLAGYTPRRIGVMLAPGSRYARAMILRSQLGDGAAPGNSTISSATSGAFAISVAPGQLGSDAYLDCGATPAAQNYWILTGDYENEAPGAAIDRAILLPEHSLPTVDEMEVGVAAAFAVVIYKQSPDLENVPA